MPDSRLPIAETQPHRRGRADPLDPRLECSLGRMLIDRRITQSEYDAGCRWRNIYHGWLCSIGAPNPFPAAINLDDVGGVQDPLNAHIDDDLAEAFAKSFRIGERALKAVGVRAFHAVNAIAVYEEPESLGDFEFTARAAKRGLAALVVAFGVAA